jgi:hypothetical protein
MAQAVGIEGVRRNEYYRAEAERVQRLAEDAAPGEGREQFEYAAAEYRSLADYYDTAAAPKPRPRAH